MATEPTHESTMTSGTGGSAIDPDLLLEHGSTSAYQLARPAALLLSTVLALQCATVARITTEGGNTNSSSHLTVAARADLFDDLLEFHERLALSQADLPEDAARLLRENLWQLYE